MTDMKLRKLAPMQHSDLVYVKKVRGKGRGVFAKGPIRKGAVVERVPVLLVPVKDLVDGWANPTLRKYFYLWNRTHVAITLGYGSLYNHSFEPNALYEHGDGVMIYRALRDIDRGEEITVNYNGDPEDQSAVEFKVV